MTSIEWLFDQINDALIDFTENKISASTYGIRVTEYKYKAKEMHKQEIIDAVGVGSQFDRDYLYGYHDKAEQYYQETFVSKGSDEVEVPKHPSVISENGNELLFDKEGNLIKELPKQDVDKLGNEDVPKLGYDVREHEILKEMRTMSAKHGFEEHSFFTRETQNQKRLSYYFGARWGYDKAKETLYTEEQVRKVAKYTISEWASLNEQREHDHEKLVKTWLSIELQNFIQSLKQPKKY
jgi:hypothetical protein